MTKTSITCFKLCLTIISHSYFNWWFDGWFCCVALQRSHKHFVCKTIFLQFVYFFWWLWCFAWCWRWHGYSPFSKKFCGCHTVLIAWCGCYRCVGCIGVDGCHCNPTDGSCQCHNSYSCAVTLKNRARINFAVWMIQTHHFSIIIKSSLSLMR